LSAFEVVEAVVELEEEALLPETPKITGAASNPL